MRALIGGYLSVFLGLFVLGTFFTNPAIFFGLLVAFVLIAIIAVVNGFKTNIPSKPSITPKDTDDSLEDDIRHHDYGYGGFGTDDDEGSHR